MNLSTTTIALFATFTLLAASACAPRVSRHGPGHLPTWKQPGDQAIRPAPAPRRASTVNRSRAPARRVVAQAPAPKAQPAPRPVASKKPKSRWHGPDNPQPKAAKVAALPAGDADDEAFNDFSDLEESDEPEAKPAPEAQPVSVRDNFYAFTDSEIRAYRKKSRSFRKLHNKMKRCTKKAEAEIAKRERIREQIIDLYNVDELPSPENKRKIAKLQAKERKMKRSQGKEFDKCRETEERLTEMLQSRYDDEEDSSARY